ncbi:MAG: MAPEG family protein [Caulobacteraceae bacterium]|nr:MAPEG family protein [Caulobacter sp.]
MTSSLYALAWTLILAVVQILLPAGFRNQETGVEYNAGPRDDPAPAPPRPVTLRLQRAEKNLYESLPLFIAAVLAAHVSGRESGLTAIGAWSFLGLRIVYVPLYANGVPYVRSVVWALSLLALLLVIAPLLLPR